MAGTDDTVADNDALYVLTAVLLTPAQFPGVLGDDYPAACAALRLEPYAEGYGLVMGQDGDGARWTVVIDDVSLVAVAIASWDCGMEYDLSPDDRSVVCALPGWPLAIAVAAPGVPAPHDPAPDPGADGEDPALLSPPDTEVWGPAQRRLGADAIASQWAHWRDQIDDATAFAPPGGESTAGTEGGASADPDRTGTETGAGSGAAAVAGTEAEDGPEAGPGAKHASAARPGVRRALAEARAYADEPPPPGRVRSSFAPGDARMIRADGPGWSMVARTDDIAFVLLDEVPGEILPVGRGTELPGLLTALDALAVRPS
ncbi:hypothetical protein P8A18_32510 [Streptomyces castrisilvae]|uniref:Integral membrane protein n=1 Tax=Streptomyces castrisilvae TaxID=3033811 RepID=A0ABY9HWH3_9ACTN|nr:hypothetical protein [Streptomyces sp. Mut1]WLQ38353.1 hypothetical protein P8A18_32510 [Streptomyces sp. Mut1]